jgi:hypothetical protein
LWDPVLTSYRRLSYLEPYPSYQSPLQGVTASGQAKLKSSEQKRSRRDVIRLEDIANISPRDRCPFDFEDRLSGKPEHRRTADWSIHTSAGSVRSKPNWAGLLRTNVHALTVIFTASMAQ